MNGSAISGYVITVYKGATVAKSMNVGPSTQVTVTGLTTGTSYTFRVAARNARGTGPQSAPSNAVVPT